MAFKIYQFLTLPFLSLHLGNISAFPGNSIPKLFHTASLVTFSSLICSSVNLTNCTANKTCRYGLLYYIYVCSVCYIIFIYIITCDTEHYTVTAIQEESICNYLLNASLVFLKLQKVQSHNLIMIMCMKFTYRYSNCSTSYWRIS